MCQQWWSVYKWHWPLAKDVEAWRYQRSTLRCHKKQCICGTTPLLTQPHAACGIIMDQRNAIKFGLESDRILLGAAVETGSPIIVEICGSLGLDWAWIDLEHKNQSAWDSSYVEHLTRAAECSGIELIVRLPNGDPALIRKVLDAGVRTILVPRVETADQLRRAIRAARFEYDGSPGERGLSQGRSSNFGASESDYHLVEDENVLVGALLESQTAVENLDEILAVPDLGFVFPGPGDLGVSIGHTKQYGHPEVLDALETIRVSCVERGIPLKGVFGSNFTNEEEAAEAVAGGFQLLGLGNEFKAVRQVFGERLKWFQ